MKKTFNQILLLILIFINPIDLFSQQSNPSCPNGALENGDETNWAQYIAPSTNPQNLSSFTPFFDGNRQGIHCGTTAPCGNFQYPQALSIYGSLPQQLTNGIDYYGGFSVPNQGVYCLRIGNNGLNQYSGGTGEADLMKYTFVVNQQNYKFKFRYAVVLQDGNHPSGQQASVGYYLVLGNKIKPAQPQAPFALLDIQLYHNTVKTVSADINNPFFKKSTKPGNVLYKDWQCVELDLSYVMGKQVTFVFWSKDCTLNGHFGYAYLDGLCTNWPTTANFTLNKTEFCSDGSSVIMDGSLTTGEDRYFLELTETTQNGLPVSNGFNFSQWFYSQVPNNFNITQWLSDNNKYLKCNSYYKIKLAAMNDCSLWNEKSQIIHYTCPEINAGPNKILCCGKEGTATDNCVPLGTTNNSNYTYSWSSYPLGFTSTSALTNQCPLNSTAYILTVTDQNGCTAKDSVIVKYKNSDAKLEIKSTYEADCAPCGYAKDYYLILKDNDCGNEDKYFTENYPGPSLSNSTVWSFYNFNTLQYTNIQNGGSTYTPPNNNGIIIATYNNGCKQITVTKTIQKYLPGSPIPNVITPNTFTPINQDGLNDELIIQDFGLNAPPLGTGPAYNAIDFELTVYDRWGSTIITIRKPPSKECIKNGDIKWDGRFPSSNGVQGSIVQQGVYNYKLRLKLCNGFWYDVHLSGSQYNPCVNTGPFGICIQHLQGFIAHILVL